MKTPWVGFGLDGTLAHYEKGKWSPLTEIGKPIPLMINLAKSYIDSKTKIKIFTARVSGGQNMYAVDAIKSWCEENGLGRPEVTCQKDQYMIVCYDPTISYYTKSQKNQGTIVEDKQ